MPNFINMEFDKALEKYPELAIENPPQYVYNSKYEDGHICEQYPSAGDKVSKDTVIKLTVVTSNEIVLIKDVTGLDYIEAETILRSSGFMVELIPTVDDSKNENTVISTFPSVNTYAPSGETVFVYYASTVSEVGSAKVPNVVGDELSIARAKITSAGLKVGSVRYEPSSEKLKDFVISQSPSQGSSVKSRTYVNLVVGSGVPATSTASFGVYLPVSSSSAKHDVKVYLNNTMSDAIPDVALDGKLLQLSITGDGEDNTFKIYIDNSLYYTGKIDYTTDPPTISNVSSYTFATSESIPDVIGSTEAQAKATLLKAGFKNVKVKTAYSDAYAEGLVCAQVPVTSSLTKYSTSIAVTITVSKGHDPAATTVPAETTTSSPPVSEPVTEPSTTAVQVVTEPFTDSTTEPLTEPSVIEPVTYPGETEPVLG